MRTRTRRADEIKDERSDFCFAFNVKTSSQFAASAAVETHQASLGMS